MPDFGHVLPRIGLLVHLFRLEPDEGSVNLLNLGPVREGIRRVESKLFGRLTLAGLVVDDDGFLAALNHQVGNTSCPRAALLTGLVELVKLKGVFSELFARQSLDL